MANVSVFFSDLQTGCSSSAVQVRLLRLWEARNVRRGGELIRFRLQSATMMLATVNVNRLATHKPHLKACLIRYVIISFDRPRWRGNCTDPPQDKNFVMATIKMDKQLLGNRWSYKTLAYTSSSTAMGLCQSGIHEHNRAQLFSCLLPHRYRVEMSVANETG
ncbi:Uncharacterized protein Rs2_02504 [Raphanus sativus]|nr:Uncharacterized protein Rs2_02504 [Raphanus sativus]